jgi:hypothetical protein
MMDRGGSTTAEWQYWKHLAEINPRTDATALWILLIRGLIFAALGSVGMLLSPRRSTLAPPPLPPNPP